jgi:hypothetical protein
MFDAFYLATDGNGSQLFSEKQNIVPIVENHYALQAVPENIRMPLIRRKCTHLLPAFIQEEIQRFSKVAE